MIMSEYNKIYYIKNREQILAKEHNRYVNNKEKISAYKR